MNKKIIIADAGPLIAFAKIDCISLLRKTLGLIILPESVQDECIADVSKTGAAIIKQAIEKKLIHIKPDPDTSTFHQLSNLLGRGESAAIALASQLKCGLLIDEKLGRSAAKKLNLQIIGTAGVLLLAKKKKYLQEVLPMINKLKSVGYYFSKDLIKELKKLAKE